MIYKPNFVCKLNKNIYGLSNLASTSTYYRKTKADDCIYIKQVKNSDGQVSFVILAVYVDDMIPVSSDINLLNAEKASLCKRFEVIDQGEAHFILGMSIRRDRKNQTLSTGQPNYIESILKRFGMVSCKPVSTLLEAGRKFQKLIDDDDPFNVRVYQQAVGCLTYLSTVTRSDIAVAFYSLLKYMSSPGKNHWVGVKRVLRYLKGTLNFSLRFSVSAKDPQMFGFSDADWAGDVDTRCSTSRYIFQIGNSTVSW